ncbi:MAG: hypothetical protein QM774_13495 [Gordonia sp. (in: high G+C Gram-positive bacteria)]|uniref:hypothetical protein n=1 Tax=Gordonia sp. (in: high G+C Gram-positive bacteria) TaxID=84139 RepID=UPI0039E2DA78
MPETTSPETTRQPQWAAASVATAVGGALMAPASLMSWARYVPALGRQPESAPDIQVSGLGGTLPDGVSYGDWKPAAWTFGVGILLVLAGLLLGIVGPRLRLMVAGVAAVAAVATLVLVAFCLSNPQLMYGLESGSAGPNLMIASEGGIWWVFAGAVMAVTGAVSAVGLARSR